MFIYFSLRLRTYSSFRSGSLCYPVGIFLRSVFESRSSAKPDFDYVTVISIQYIIYKWDCGVLNNGSSVPIFIMLSCSSISKKSLIFRFVHENALLVFIRVHIFHVIHYPSEYYGYAAIPKHR